jgi:hypothetical protein
MNSAWRAPVSQVRIETVSCHLSGGPGHIFIPSNPRGENMEQHEHPPHKTVRIHVDQKRFESPSPTPAVDLYELAAIPESRVLYREVKGDHEDELVPIDQREVHLQEDEHFHSADLPGNHYVITVNTDPVVIHHDVLTFDELVKIAYPNPPSGQDPQFTITFEHAASQPHQGDLPEGGSVTVKKHGTIFDVEHTNRS